ncbi:MAG: hypothetical protein FWH22_09465 [Fibromonadales bacterium]|nr:hypothetical protein [Fibromonadales bacterium]
MNVSGNSSVANNYSSYTAKNTSQASNKPFAIPAQELKLNGPLTFIGNNPFTDPFDPFKEIAQTGSFKIPEHIQTKTTPTRSDEEILKDMIELAKKHAQQGTLHGSRDQEYAKLIDEYVSSVSPDREGVLKNAVNEIYERLNPRAQDDYCMSSIYQQVASQRDGEKEKEEEEPIDYFIELLKNKGKVKNGSGTISSVTKNGDYATVEIDHGKGMKTFLHYAHGKFSSMQISGNNYFVQVSDKSQIANGKVDNAKIYDDNGEWIASYDHNSGLRQKYTEAEGARVQELLDTYNAAYEMQRSV